MKITVDKEVLEQAYLAGFMASREGYNGEFPFDELDLPIDNKAWLKDRDNALRDVLAETERKPLSVYINSAGINANDSPHIVIEKLERVMMGEGK